MAGQTERPVLWLATDPRDRVDSTFIPTVTDRETNSFGTVGHVVEPFLKMHPSGFAYGLRRSRDAIFKKKKKNLSGRLDEPCLVCTAI